MEVCPLLQEVSIGTCNKRAWGRCPTPVKVSSQNWPAKELTAERKRKIEQDGRTEMNQREGPDQSWGGKENQKLQENKPLYGWTLFKNIRSRTSGKTEKLSCALLYYKVQDNWFYLKIRERKVWMSNPMQSY